MEATAYNTFKSSLKVTTIVCSKKALTVLIIQLNLSLRVSQKTPLL